MKGTVRKLGLEGGVWALITDDGQAIELIGPPESLCRDGQRAEIVPDRAKSDVTIGMVGDAVRVRSFRLL